MPSKNLVIISSAGSRKTTYIVEEALKHSDKKILITTYTIDNLNQIRNYITERNHFIPDNICVQTWYSFLLQHCVRPYQNYVYDKKRIENILLIAGRSPFGISRSNIQSYYFSGADKVYTDKISEFTCVCNSTAKGLVIKRLENIFDEIFIDEIQDLAGYDFDLLELLFRSTIGVTVVGDIRQATYATNYSPKYAKFRGRNIIMLFEEWESNNLCSITERVDCYRCNQIICDFADNLYPDLPKSISKNFEKTGHDGIFLVSPKDLQEYIKEFQPQVLRYRKSDQTDNLNAMNFGISKGQTFDRVLIFPTSSIDKYLKTANVKAITDFPKFYVAITRAKFSVAFLSDVTSAFEQMQSYQP